MGCAADESLNISPCPYAEAEHLSSQSAGNWRDVAEQHLQSLDIRASMLCGLQLCMLTMLHSHCPVLALLALN